MKNYLSKFIFIALFITNSKNMNSQTSPEGKTYIANIRSTCKMMQGGGCTIDDYCSMTFTKNEVTVFYYTKVNCTPKSREKNYKNPDSEKKTYKWTLQNNIVTIENFNDYGTYEIQEIKLLAKKSADTPLEFVVQVKK